MRKSLSLLIIVFSLGACADGQDDKSQRQSDLQAMEAEMQKKEQLDTALASSMIAAYEAYLSTYPKDSLAPFYQKKIAEMYRAYPGKERAAIENYEELIDKYTYHDQGAKALLSLALFYEELQQKDLAIATYQRFLDRFPSHPLATQAEQLKQLLADDSVSDIQMVEEWMRKAKDSTQNSDK